MTVENITLALHLLTVATCTGGALFAAWEFWK